MNNWKEIKTEGVPPTPPAINHGGFWTQDASCEILLYDGDSVWNEIYFFEEDEQHLRNNASHWMYLSDVETPNRI